MKGVRLRIVCLKLTEKVGLNFIFLLNLWFMCSTKQVVNVNEFSWLFCPSLSKNLSCDEIPQKLNNLFCWNGSREFHISCERQENMIHIHNVTKNFSDLCISSFLTYPINSPLYGQVISHTREKEVIHSVSFPRSFILVYIFAVGPFKYFGKCTA